MRTVPEPEGRWSASFSANSAAPVEARCWLQGLLDSIQDGVDGPAALLLLTELVTNAIHYSRSRLVHVDVELLGDKLVVGVSDNEPTPPRSRPPRPEDTSGRGLILVDSLSAGWGVSPQQGGKTVWFNLDRKRP